MIVLLKEIFQICAWPCKSDLSNGVRKALLVHYYTLEAQDVFGERFKDTIFFYILGWCK